MPQPHDITIVVLTYNRRDCLRELLEELMILAADLKEVIVVDNCSTDGTTEMVDSDFPDIKHIVTDRNRGACARNIGMLEASGEVVVTLDDDISGLTKDHLAWLTNAFSRSPGVGAINFRVVDGQTGKLANWVHHRHADCAERRFITYEITEGAVAFRRGALQKTGGYFEEYFISHEGPDLAFRMMNAGYEVVYDGAITVKHKHERSARRPWRFYYFDTRNQFLLATRTMPWSYAIPYLIRGLGAMAVYSVRDGFTRWYLRGIRDGLLLIPTGIGGREKWTDDTAIVVREVDRHRPGFWAMVRKRLSQEKHRLEG